MHLRGSRRRRRCLLVDQSGGRGQATGAVIAPQRGGLAGRLVRGDLCRHGRTSTVARGHLSHRRWCCHSECDIGRIGSPPLAAGLRCVRNELCKPLDQRDQRLIIVFALGVDIIDSLYASALYVRMVARWLRILVIGCVGSGGVADPAMCPSKETVL